VLDFVFTRHLCGAFFAQVSWRVRHDAVCESERTPAVQDLVAKYDPLRKAPAAREAHRADAPGMRFGDLGGGHGTFGHEARRDDSPKVRLGDLGGPVVEDPAAPRSTTPAARGTTHTT
jgi:hypothetical protein